MGQIRWLIIGQLIAPFVPLLALWLADLAFGGPVNKQGPFQRGQG